MSYRMKFVVCTAGLLSALAIFGFGAGLAGYSQAMHPIALLGARGIPHALAFNILGFMLPGLLLSAVAWRWRAAMPDDASWPIRIGARLVLLSALAFALQGLLPLDPGDLESTASRLHATAWTLWWVAFVPGALLLAFGMRSIQSQRRFAWACVVAAALLAWLALAPQVHETPGVAQRGMLAAWFGWWLLAACRTAGWSPEKTD